MPPPGQGKEEAAAAAKSGCQISKGMRRTASKRGNPFDAKTRASRAKDLVFDALEPQGPFPAGSPRLPSMTMSNFPRPKKELDQDRGGNCSGRPPKRSGNIGRAIWGQFLQGLQ